MSGPAWTGNRGYYGGSDFGYAPKDSLAYTCPCGYKTYRKCNDAKEDVNEQTKKFLSEGNT